VSSIFEQAQTGHLTVIRVPVFTSEIEQTWSTLGSCRIWSTLNVISCQVRRLSITVSPRAPSRAKAMATIVLSALPCAPPGRRCIGFPRGNPHREVENAGDRLGRNARTVVGDGDGAVGNLNLDGRSNTGLLGSVDRVINQLLEDHERPLIGAMTDLLRQLAFR